jgi:presenilin-like A22 family membrane protease
MKHNVPVTAALIVFFVLAQIIGLVLINADSKVEIVDGKPTVVHQETSLGPRPELSGLGTFAYIAIGLIIGTLLILLIIRLKKVNIWKAWFFLAVFLAISLSLGVFLNIYVAFILAFILAIIKVMKPNIIIHNITEVLMYSGIAIFLVPLLNVLWAFILLIAISLYDIYAVFKSKHMVTMAKFQAKSQVFAGLFIPYTAKAQPAEQKASISQKSAKKSLPKEFPINDVMPEQAEKKNAVLGGGDVAFPLLFTGAVMESLVVKGLTQANALGQSLIITLTTTIAIALLFIFAKKDKFYPAMPVVTAGCLIGYGIVLLL